MAISRDRPLQDYVIMKKINNITSYLESVSANLMRNYPLRWINS